MTRAGVSQAGIRQSVSHPTVHVVIMKGAQEEEKTLGAQINGERSRTRTGEEGGGDGGAAPSKGRAAQEWVCRCSAATHAYQCGTLCFTAHEKQTRTQTHTHLSARGRGEKGKDIGHSFAPLPPLRHLALSLSPSGRWVPDCTRCDATTHASRKSAPVAAVGGRRRRRQ